MKQLGKEASLLLYVGILTSTILGVFFIQKSGGSNTFNFLVSAWLFLTIPAALLLISTQKKRVGILVALVVIATTVPRVIQATYQDAKGYFSFERHIVQKPELALYAFFEQEVPHTAVILVDPAHPMDTFTPYVPALIPQRSFLSGKGILDSHGQDANERERMATVIGTSRNGNEVAHLLNTYGIDYILLYADHRLPPEADQFTSVVFSNEAGSIVKVEIQ